MRFPALLVAIALAACSEKAAPVAPVPEPAPVVEVAPGAEIPVSEITVSAPLPNARVQSPLVAEGVAPNNFYFEAVFVAKLLAADGSVIAEGPAQAQSPWTTPGPVKFLVSLPFKVAADTPATLLLQEDMPRDDIKPRELRIPVVLAAGSR